MSARRGSDRPVNGLPRIVPFDSRERIARALAGCSAQERALLALMLYEKLTANEAADALGMQPADVERVYSGLMQELDGALASSSTRARRPRLGDDPLEFRKAS
jgi:DNA-directed RNA polymerase specialized sigma24 family protein